MRPYHPQRRCVRENSSTLSHRRLRHAHSLPFAPSTKANGSHTIGSNPQSATHVRFLIPHAQPNKKAPQFQPLTSAGISEATPRPDVFSGALPGATEAIAVPPWQARPLRSEPRGDYRWHRGRIQANARTAAAELLRVVTC